MALVILILAANPKSTSRLRLDEEVREIDIGLQRANKRNDFVLHQKWAVRPIDIRRAVLDINPNIVHFCGHGAEIDGLAFEDNLGQPKLIDAEALASFFALFADTVQCVVLNACYSELQAKAIARSINYVVGMRTGISDIAAIEFSVAFYDALGAGKNIEFAYKLACTAIQWSGLSEYSTPVFITRTLSTDYDISRKPNNDDWGGRWKGYWLNPRGHRFDFELFLYPKNDFNLDGHIVWTLSVSPLLTDRDKIGLSAKEYVSGTINLEKHQLTLVGEHKDDPHSIIGMDTYKLLLSNDGKKLAGTSLYVGTWAGKMQAIKY
jgi:hypothetical protein